MRSLFFKVAASAAVIAFLSAASAQAAQTNYSIMCNYNKSGLLAQVTLNGYPIVALDARDDTSCSMMMNQWVREGKNTLVIHLEAYQNTNFEPSDLNHFEIYFTRQPSGGYDSKAVKFGWLDYPPLKKGSIMTHETMKLPYDKTVEFTVKDKLPGDFWKQAKELKLTDDLKKQALGIAEELYNSIAKKDLDKMLLLCDYQITETAKLSYTTPEDYKKMFVKFTKMMWDDTNFTVLPFNKDALKMELICDGLILRVENLKINEDTKIDLNLGDVNGKLTMVR